MGVYYEGMKIIIKDYLLKKYVSGDFSYSCKEASKSGYSKKRFLFYNAS